MKRVGVVSLILSTLLVVSVVAKSDNANSKSEDKCNNGLGNDKEKCYDGDKADSINGNAYGLSTNKFAVSSDDSSVDEETQQANEETLTEFEEVHQTVAENFLLIKEIPPEIEIISEEPQYVNGEVVARVYNLGTKATARAVDEVSGYMVMTLNEGDTPIKAYSFESGGFESLPPFYREFLNLRLYGINKVYELVESNSSLRGVKKRHPMWDILLDYTPDKPKPKITSVNIDLNRGKKVKTNYGKAKGKDKRYIVGEETLTKTEWEQREPYNNLAPRFPNINSANTIRATYDSVTTAYRCRDVHIDELHKNDSSKIEETINNAINNINDIYRYNFNPYSLIATVYLSEDTTEIDVRDCNLTEAGEVNAYSLRVPTDVNDLNNDETKALSGCVPTAWGQIMKYHKWPPKAVGELDYDFTYIGDSDKYYNIKVNRDLNHGFDFNWSNEIMPLAIPENLESISDNIKTSW